VAVAQARGDDAVGLGAQDARQTFDGLQRARPSRR
jgi:hypothetical protein